MSTYLTPASWVLLKTYTFKSLSSKDTAIQAAFEQARHNDSTDSKTASLEVVFKLGVCIRKIQSIIRGFVARRRVLWLKSSLEECARIEFFNYIKNLKNTKSLRFKGWISEWFLNKGFGFIRLDLSDELFDYLPKDKYGPRLTIFCMRTEFRFLTTYPRGAVNFRLIPNPKFPDNLMASDIIECNRVANVNKPYSQLPVQIKCNESNRYDNCGGMERYYGKIESFNNTMGTGVIKYNDFGDINYHIFFHHKNVKKPKRVLYSSYLREGQNVSLQVGRNNINPSLLTAVKIIPV